MPSIRLQCFCSATFGDFDESFLLMLAVSLVMMAFGMRAQDAFFIGLIMGVMNVVPYAGPTIGSAVSVCMGYHHPDRRDVDPAIRCWSCRIAVDFEGAG